MNHYKKINYFTLLLAFVVLLIASCAKDGAVGPTGAKGPKGVTGATGATGLGTANTIYSDWIIPPAYTPSTYNGHNHLQCNIAASGITQNILDNGTVVVYAKLVYTGIDAAIWPANQEGALPIDVGGHNTTDTWSAYVTLGNIQIDVVNSSGTFANAIGTGHSFRYVIVPGTVHTAGSINPNNHQQVVQAVYRSN